MKRILRTLSFCFLLNALAAACFAQNKDQPLRLRSPGGEVEIRFSLNAAGAPTYAVDYKGRALVAPSTLGLGLKQGGALSGGMKITAAHNRSHDSSYELVVGKTRRARDRYRELTVALEESAGSKRRLQLVFRAYDDGVAFRYFLPTQEALTEFEITGEMSEFRFPSDHACWAMQLRTFHSNYEKEFDKITLSRIKPGAKVGLPLVVQTAGGITLAIAEANLKDYAGMYLHGLEGAPHSLVSRLSPFGGREEGSAVSARAPHASPWRVVMI
ncbi:MAG TPA: glycoside hydrolase family 97 N-terminal domain-containing protein, partial [Pyrinomonadaceae bacterium]